MRIDRLEELKTRIARIEGRIAAITGESTPVAAVESLGFSSALQQVSSKISAMPASTWDGLIEEAAATYGLDPKLLKAVMMSESGGRPNAVSSAGAMGLMQLMPATADSLGVANPFDPRQNIFGGARYLKSLIDRLGSPELAIAAYNAGPGAVKKYGGIPPYPETQNYVQRVMSRWKGSGQ